MRTSLAAALIAALVPACESGIEGTGGGDAGGSGSADAFVDPNTPHVTLSVDKTTVTTELRTTQEVTVTATSVMGFTGAVNLSASVVDSANATLSDWVATFDNTTVNLTANGTATAKVTVKVPTKFAGATDTLKIEGTSSAPVTGASSTLNVTNQITYRMSVNGGACVFPADYGKLNNRDLIVVGTKVRWFNEDTTDSFEIHMNSGDAYGFSHQAQGTYGTADPVTEPNTAYEQTAVTDSNTDVITWYCHNPDSGNATATIGAIEIL